MQQWGAERVGALTALVAEGAPGEDLTADELLTACYEQPGVVLATDEGDGVVAVGVGRHADGTLVASVRLVVAVPSGGGRRVSDTLLAAAEGWAAERGAEQVVLGGALPFPLWPGVDDGPLEQVAEGRGYERRGECAAVAVPAAFRAAAPEGVEVRRAVRDDDVTAVTLAVASSWPRRSDEVARALDHGTCHVALATASGAGPQAAVTPSQVLGVGCHSVTRASWVGPLVVAPGARRRGIGHALLGQVCRDLMIAEFPAAEVHGVDTPETEAFLVAAGGTTVRRYRHLVLDLAP